MADNNDQSQQQQQDAGKTAGKVVSAGKPVLMTGFNTQQSSQQQQQQQSQADADKNKEAGKQQHQQQQQQQEPPKIDEAGLKAYFESKGIQFTSLDDVEKRLKPAEQKHEPTPEEIKSKADKREEKALKLFMSKGGTIEQFANIKSLTSADVNALTEVDLVNELKKENFSDEQIKEIVKERYYQFTDDEIELQDDQKVKDILKKKKELGSKKLQARGENIKKEAQSVLNGLYEAVDSEDLQAQKEEQFSSMVDEHFNKLSRKITFDLGTVDEHKLDPIEYDVTEDLINDAKATLKDPQKRKELLFDKDGNVNLPNVAALVVRNKYLENALKVALLEGQSRQVAAYELVFPNSTKGLSLNKNSNNGGKTTGKLISAGKPTVSSRPVTQK